MSFRVSRFAVAVLFAFCLPTAGQELQRDPARVRKGLVVSVDEYASKAGAEVLREGGNAVDAAVATAFALAVTHPEAGNIGGGGFMLVRLAASGEAFAVDYREVAPALATPTMFLDEQGNVDPNKVEIGWVVVGVPGSPMGLWTAHQKAGKLPWKRLLEPAIGLAEQGFEVDSVLHAGLKTQEADLARLGEAGRIYLVDGRAPSPGHTLKLPDLARTLRKIMDEGPDGFYKGEVAEQLDRAMRANGGLLRKEDLANYRAVIRQPVRGSYRGHEIISICPPSSGGVALLGMLNVLEGFNLHGMGHNTPESMHHLAETMKRVYYSRAKYMGDPDFVELPVAMLLSKEHATQLRSSITDKATPSARIGADILIVSEPADTTHFSIIDGEGNMVSNTTTLEGSYGAKVIAPGTGFLLNNQMHDFNVKPGLTDAKGHIGTPPNLIAPGKRMLSSQTPTLVIKDGKPFLILGSPGGRTIINTVLQVILNVIDHEMPIQRAVDVGRMHHQWLPDEIVIEDRVSETLIAPLEARGHQVKRRGRQGDCHAILIDPQTGEYLPGIDRRRRGSAFGF